MSESAILSYEIMQKLKGSPLADYHQKKLDFLLEELKPYISPDSSTDKTEVS